VKSKPKGKTVTKKAAAKKVPKAKALPPVEPKEETMVAYKGFGPDWKCRDFQFAVGQTYEHSGRVEACSSGFHACEDPLHVLRYYRAATSRFAVVEQSGTLARHDEDSRVASSRIKIKAEIGLPGLIKAAIEYRFARAKAIDPKSPESSKENYGAATASGNYGAATASGDYGAATASGYSGAATASGYSGAATASGTSGAATASGYYGAATASGQKSVALASGYNGKARAVAGGAIFLVERGRNYNILTVFASKVGENGIAADTWYVLRGGKPVVSP
jgi:hypothetical protein